MLKAYNKLHYDGEPHKIGYRWTFSDWTKIYYWNRFQREWIKKNHSQQMNAWIKQRQKLWLENSEIESKLYEMGFYMSWTLCSITFSPVSFCKLLFCRLDISLNVFCFPDFFAPLFFFSRTVRMLLSFNCYFLGEHETKAREFMRTHW